MLDYDTARAKHRVRISASLAAVIASWGQCTRLSPIFGVRELRTSSVTEETFQGSVALLLLGPVQPAVPLELCPESVRAWVSLGAFNVILYSTDISAVDSLRQWAAANNVGYEQWNLLDGEIRETLFAPRGSPASSLDSTLSRLERLAGHLDIPDLRDAVTEFCALMATTVQRAGRVWPALSTTLENAIETAESTLQMVNRASSLDCYRALGTLTSMNAGLSRLSSQMLSGTSPVALTESHYWTHSLLGTGIANIVLARLAHFAHDRLARKRIPERLEALASQTSNVPVLTRNLPEDYWHGDHLERVVVPEERCEEPVHLLTYYSGRDGFRSHLNTLSAPLTSISACNTTRWSLITLTHELSHVLIRGALSFLYPDPTSSNLMGRLAAMVRGVEEPRNTLESLQQLLVAALLSMEVADRGPESERPETLERALPELLDAWHHEVEEIMVHVFDFLFFYGQSLDHYINSIWHSWAVIPNIGNRVHEYTLRTLAVALVPHLRRSVQDAENLARHEVLERLRRMCSAGTPEVPYVRDACEMLEDDARWERVFRPALVARKSLVKIVRGFLYWETAAADMLRDEYLGGATRVGITA